MMNKYTKSAAFLTCRTIPRQGRLFHSYAGSSHEVWDQGETAHALSPIVHIVLEIHAVSSYRGDTSGSLKEDSVCVLPSAKRNHRPEVLASVEVFHPYNCAIARMNGHPPHSPLPGLEWVVLLNTPRHRWGWNCARRRRTIPTGFSSSDDAI